jgi:antitoxin component YwqK of YwqJK toxin-antitoxin module
MIEANYIYGDLVSETRYHYFENGQIKSELNINASNVTSKYRKWYENGQIESEEHYKERGMTRDGKWTEWDENGQIKSEKNYKDGECISGDC